MNKDNLEVIEKWYQYQSTGDAKTVLKLIKYVRQLEKEKLDEGKVVDPKAQASMTISSEDYLKTFEANAELLSALKPVSHPHHFDLTMEELKTMNEAYTKHSTEGGE